MSDGYVLVRAVVRTVLGVVVLAGAGWLLLALAALSRA